MSNNLKSDIQKIKDKTETTLCSARRNVSEAKSIWNTGIRNIQKIDTTF